MEVIYDIYDPHKKNGVVYISVHVSGSYHLDSRQLGLSDSLARWGSTNLQAPCGQCPIWVSQTKWFIFGQISGICRCYTRSLKSVCTTYCLKICNSVLLCLVKILSVLPFLKLSLIYRPIIHFYGLVLLVWQELLYRRRIWSQPSSQLQHDLVIYLQYVSLGYQRHHQDFHRGSRARNKSAGTKRSSSQQILPLFRETLLKVSLQDYLKS